MSAPLAMARLAAVWRSSCVGDFLHCQQFVIGARSDGHSGLLDVAHGVSPGGLPVAIREVRRSRSFSTSALDRSRWSMVRRSSITAFVPLGGTRACGYFAAVSVCCLKVVRLGEHGSGQGRGMQAAEVRRAVAAALSTASSLDLTVDDAIVLNNSNRLTLRLLPGDVLAQVAPLARQVAQFEVDLAQRLAESGCPVAALEPRVEPRVYERDGFVITLWTYYEPVTSREIPPADYANALERLHAGMRKLDVPTPHFSDRVESAQQLVASRDRTPALADADRELLGDTLRSLRRVIGERGGEQLLHGEPHPGNVLTTKNGLLFIDLETCCRGPIEFDLAHAPEEVGEHYRGANQDLLRKCRILVLAMITTWRWERGDQLPNGRQLGIEWLNQIRAALDKGPAYYR
jgi:hypothetical protein